jgi:hypothetical protein
MSENNRSPGNQSNNDNNWKQVKNKRSTMTKENLEEKMSSMIKTKVTVMIRVPPNAAADYSAAEIHIATIRELSKQDANLIVLNHEGKSHVNIHKSFGEEKYKEYFKPREKSFKNGTVQVSVAHYVLTENQSFNKALLIPFLKKHSVYVFFNQKDGLEHFAAIGVLFGPHPELAWRQTIAEQLEKTIQAEIITAGDKLDSNSNENRPNVVISLVPQQISNPKHNQTKSIALEVRVPADQEAKYIEILDRLNERTVSMEQGEVDIVMEENIGTFFPYYAKRQKAELFDMLMRRQNFEMTVVSAIPIFGYTQKAKETEIEHEGTMQMVQAIIWNHPSINAIEPTASSATLGKYILLVDREFKDDVEDFVDLVFDKMPELTEQPENFKKPQRGGNAFKKNRINNISNYLKTLEESVAIDQMLTDDDSEYSASPPIRRRRPTISYAQATKRLSFNNETILGQSKDTNNNANATAMTTMSTLTQNSLDEALQKIRTETARSIAELRDEMKTDVKSMEQNIAATVIAAINSKENPINMEVESTTDGGSTGAVSHDTATTMKTVMDKFESLTQIVIQLAEKVKILADNQETMTNKRSRPQEHKKSDIPTNDKNGNESRSPPAKQPRPPATPPSTPPPYGHPEQGAREGN